MKCSANVLIPGTYIRAGVSILAETAEISTEIDVERARQAVGTPFDRLFKLNV